MSFMKLFGGSKKSSNLDQSSSQQDNIVTQSRSSTDGAPEDFPHSQDVASQPQRKDSGHKSQKKTSKNENDWIESVPHEDEELAGNIKRMSTRMSVSRSGRFKSKGQQRRSVSDDVYHGRTTTSGGETGRTETSRSISINSPSGAAFQNNCSASSNNWNKSGSNCVGQMVISPSSNSQYTAV